MWAAIRLVRAVLLFGRIFASYLIQLGLQRALGRARVRARWQRVHRANARRMYKGFVRLRGVYIKLGQILSIMGTFLPKAYTDELEGLQDEVPPRPFADVARAVTKALGKGPHEAFARFSERPIAAASLGQVHEATTHGGERVAVKVLYPDVATIIRVDLRVLGWSLRVYRRFVPIQQLERVHEQLEDMLARETDLAHEANCLERMAENFIDDEDVLFPRVHRELSTRTVLTMSFMEGVKISRLDRLSELGLDPIAVATKLVEVFYKQLFFDRFFHADPHPGNFFVQRGPEGQPRLVVLDFGAASEVSAELVDGMLDILTGVMTRQDDLVVTGVERMGFIAPSGDRALLERTVRTYFVKLLELDIRDFGKISPDVAHKLADPGVKQGELRALMKSFEYPHGWFFVERAVVILFGLSAQIAPTLNGVKIGLPYVMRLFAQRQASAGAVALSSSAGAASESPAVPRRTSRDSRPAPESPTS